jgi:hypothetical protein
MSVYYNMNMIDEVDWVEEEECEYDSDSLDFDESEVSQQMVCEYDSLTAGAYESESPLPPVAYFGRCH